jgi:hypothetical protein
MGFDMTDMFLIRCLGKSINTLKGPDFRVQEIPSEPSRWEELHIYWNWNMLEYPELVCSITE